jgi:hypothetical protein
VETFDDVELPDEYLLELGRIVVGWNRLESLLLHTLVSALIEDSSTYNRALAVFTHMAFPQKLDALSAMLRTIEPEFYDLYHDEVQGMLKQAQESRNTALHQFWYNSQDGDVKRANVKARGKLQVTHQPVSPDDLKKVVRSLEEAHDVLLATISFPLSLKFRTPDGP